MKTYAPFQEALPKGHEAERRVASILLRAGAQVQHRSNRSSFDLTATLAFGRPELIEVKNEDEYAQSGNICLELTQGKEGKPRRASGLAISESTVMVHTLGKQLALYRTRDMRLFVKQCGIKPQPFGDWGNEGIIMPLNRLEGQPWFDLTDDEHLAQSRVFRKGATDGE